MPSWSVRKTLKKSISSSSTFGNNDEVNQKPDTSEEPTATQTEAQNIDMTTSADLNVVPEPTAPPTPPKRPFMELVNCFLANRRQLNMIAVCFRNATDQGRPRIYHYSNAEKVSVDVGGGNIIK